MLLIDECVLKIAKKSVVDCHLSPVRRQMIIQNSVFNDFWSTFVDNINIFDCRLSSVDKLDLAGEERELIL